MRRGTRGIRDDRGREHGVGRRQERAEQERLGPVEVGQRVRHHGDERRGQRHGEHELAQRQVPLLLEQLLLDLEPVAEQDQDQGDDRERADEVRLGVELEHLDAALAEDEPRHARRARSARGSCAWRPPRRSDPTTSSPPSTATATSKLWKSCTGVIFARDGLLGHPDARRPAPPPAGSALRRGGAGRHDQPSRRRGARRSPGPRARLRPDRATARSRSARRQHAAGGPGFLAQFEPNERHEVRATSDTRLVLFLAPWPGEGHPSQR